MTNHYVLLHQYYLNGVRKKYYSPPISDEEWTASIDVIKWKWGGKGKFTTKSGNQKSHTK
jgi:hypothetical protein